MTTRIYDRPTNGHLALVIVLCAVVALLVLTAGALSGNLDVAVEALAVLSLCIHRTESS